MKPANQKITSFGFLLLGLMPLLFTVSFIIQQKIIRHEMREKLSTDKLQTIVVNENDVIWMDDHEIWINDHMFDIHTRELKNGTYTFTGLYDERETQLMEQNKKTTDKNSEEGRMLSELFKCLPVLFHEPDKDIFPGSYPLYTFFEMPADRLANPFNTVPTPPPDHGYCT